MKHLLLIIGPLIFGPVSAQDTLKLKIDNPAPRVGDEIEISFSLDFIFDEIEDQMNDNIVVSDGSFYGLDSDYFRKTIAFTKEGEQTVGPFQFDFNGKKLVTDSITLVVGRKLPFEEGVWIRVVVDGEGQKYLIIEQLIAIESENQEYDEISYAEINDDYIDGVSLGNTRSINSTRRKNEDDFLAPRLSYSFQQYKFTVSDRYEGTFRFQKHHFKNLPKKAYFIDYSEKR